MDVHKLVSSMRKYKSWPLFDATVGALRGRHFISPRHFPPFSTSTNVPAKHQSMNSMYLVVF